MASLAGLLQLRGHRITGSDKAAYPPMSDLLRELGIPVLEPYAEKNLDPRPDLVVVGNALSRGNPETRAGARRAHSVHVDGGAVAGGVSHRARVARGGGHARKDDDHQHAGVDLPVRRGWSRRF